ncbi:MAG: hypothetical protein ABI769_14720 [Pseudomonadota bacterium]
MKPNNQTEHHVLELAATKAANEDGISPSTARDVTTPVRKQSWSPAEVWRTRVKGPTKLGRTETAQNQR